RQINNDRLAGNTGKHTLDTLVDGRGQRETHISHQFQNISTVVFGNKDSSFHLTPVPENALRFHYKKIFLSCCFHQGHYSNIVRRTTDIIEIQLLVYTLLRTVAGGHPL